MNETYEWLYDKYALPLMESQKYCDEMFQELRAHAAPEERLWFRDQVERLLFVWGTEAFTVGLQLGLRLMAGQRAEILALS